MRRFGSFGVLLVVVGLSVVLAVGVAGAGGSATSARAGWVVTDLGALSGTWYQVTGINEQGQVIGFSARGSGASFRSRAFVSQNGKMTDLGTLGGQSTVAWDINDLGQVVGDGTTTTGEGHAFLWQDGKMTDLGVLGLVPASGQRERAMRYSHAVAINERGQVIGVSGTRAAGGYSHPFLWENGKMIDLGALVWRGRKAEPMAMNDRGQIVGWSRLSAKVQRRAFLWQDGKMTDLGTLGYGISWASAINNQGQIVGCNTGGGGRSSKFDHGLLWRAGSLVDLGPMSNCRVQIAINELGQIVGGDGFFWDGKTLTRLGFATKAMNDRGQVVGQTFRGTAALWQDGTTITLPSLKKHGYELAQAINNRGQIAGISENTLTNNPTPRDAHVVLWTQR
jgi:probable HAF family extracellular repeat protein